MKGLLYTHMGRRDEGIELVKKGIRLDLTSHICWHVYGLIQKGEKDYEGALKSYTQALKFDKENLNLLNDAANLQTQLRQFEGLQETRELILQLRPNARKNWISLAVAYHLNGKLSNAKKVLENYVRIVKNVPDYDSEHSEVVLYYVRVLEELGELGDALLMLDSNAKSRVIVDRTAVMETRARLLSKLDNTIEAEEAWRQLIERNSECYDYYRELLKLKGISLDAVTDENRDTILETLQELSDLHTRATAPRRIALAVSTGANFKDRAHNYLLNGIRRGLPSLFADVKSLYSDSTKQQAIEEIIEELKSTFAPPPASDATNGDTSSDTEPPTTYLWTLYFLAQHHSHLHRYSLASSVLDIAIAHTPTLPELHACKGRLLKRAGDLVGAVRCIEEARRLDRQDRFLNTKSAKYHQRAGLLDEAQAILGLFTKKDAATPGADLEDMQSLLYLTEEADAQNRLGRLGLALKKYLAIQKVFDDFNNDQYDFHFYSLRRFTINPYIGLLHWEDALQSQPAYVKSALEAARIYISVYDDPKLASSSSSNRSEAEKKAQKKAKKAALKNQEDSKKTAVANASSVNEDRGIEPPAPKDEDVDGSKALAAPDSLEQAWKLVKPLMTQTNDRMDVYIGVYDVSVRRQKYLQALKALLSARLLDPGDPELHLRIVDFKQRVSSLAQPLAQPLDSVISSALSTLIPADLALDTFNSQYLQRHSTSATAALAAAQVLHRLKAPREEVESTVFGILAPETVVDIKSASKALQFLADIGSSRKDEFRSKCDERFELSTVFKTPEELARLRSEALAESQGDAVEDKAKQEVP
ncbi:NMDA receptor-regulated protein 1a [Phellopilus nigrolimitatus]|nr:NMDA receptor-regulated protein 1a [Phellopilus nigrolimitatus]